MITVYYIILTAQTGTVMVIRQGSWQGQKMMSGMEDSGDGGQQGWRTHAVVETGLGAFSILYN